MGFLDKKQFLITILKRNKHTLYTIEIILCFYYDKLEIHRNENRILLKKKIMIVKGSSCVVI